MYMSWLNSSKYEVSHKKFVKWADQFAWYDVLVQNNERMVGCKKAIPLMPKLKETQ